ncbi:MAG TPA: transposase [Acidimicrobiales bacterium]|nr:transposase [Acidimicrobiales bacterium]
MRLAHRERHDHRLWNRPHRRQSGSLRAVEALGLDEVLMVRLGRFCRQEFSTQIVDVGRGQLLDVVPGRSSAGPMAWLAEQGKPWCDQVRFATLDLSGPYQRSSPSWCPTPSRWPTRFI